MPQKSKTSSRAKPTAKSKTTIDHDEIRRWAESRDGHPARVRARGAEADGRTDRSGGILRIDFGKPEKNLEEISWEEFFEVFDQDELAFLYQEKTATGRTSRFFKLIRRENAKIDR